MLTLLYFYAISNYAKYKPQTIIKTEYNSIGYNNASTHYETATTACSICLLITAFWL